MCLAYIFGIILNFLTLVQDSVEVTGSEVGERGGGRIGKGPRAGIQTRDVRSAICWHTAYWLLVPTYLA